MSGRPVILWRKILAAIAVTSALLVTVGYTRRQLGLDLDPMGLRATVQSFGSLGPLVFISLVSLRMFLGLPSQLLMVVGGLCFGIALGTLYGATGLVCSGVCTFIAARWAGREAIMRRVPEKLQPIFDRAGSRLGAVFIFIGTGYPIGFITGYNALAAVTNMTFLQFLPAVMGGSLVRAGLFAYFGDSLTAGGFEALVGATIAILCVAILPLLFPPSRRWIASLLMH
jgi:uncharacterized membrane protein YdjX (TVP38/TMEM64 family)